MLNVRSNYSTYSTVAGGAATAAVVGPATLVGSASGVIGTYTGSVLTSAGSGAVWGSGVGGVVGGAAMYMYMAHGQDKEEV